MAALSLAAQPARTGITGTFVHSPTYNIMPAQGVSLDQLRGALKEHDAEINRTIGQRYINWRQGTLR